MSSQSNNAQTPNLDLDIADFINSGQTVNEYLDANNISRPDVDVTCSDNPYILK